MYSVNLFSDIDLVGFSFNSYKDVSDFLKVVKKSPSYNAIACWRGSYRFLVLERRGGVWYNILHNMNGDEVEAFPVK